MYEPGVEPPQSGATPLPELNRAFFGNLTNTYLVLQANFGKRRGLQLLERIVRMGLEPAYARAGFEQGDPGDFKRVVEQRDRSLGVDSTVEILNRHEFSYRFRTDFFSRLRAHLTPAEADSVHLGPKIDILLGDGWRYESTQHLWFGDDCTEYFINLD